MDGREEGLGRHFELDYLPFTQLPAYLPLSLLLPLTLFTYRYCLT
uniref:Uncharacterized protein n=1 Tax=Picea sitchensis TaxID=3332 RepID=A0A6B9XW89_PICSI|nr:hypothetical protein Q903MT_gene4279 [Picea sitchensis]